MPVTKKRPKVAWWVLARTEEDLAKKNTLHATFADENETTLCGLTIDETSFADRRVNGSKKGKTPCLRCSGIIDRHKEMYRVDDPSWPYASFPGLSHA